MSVPWDNDDFKISSVAVDGDLVAIGALARNEDWSDP